MHIATVARRVSLRFRARALLFVLATGTSAFAWAANVPLHIGGTQIRFPADGEVALSQAAPKRFAQRKKFTLDRNHLIESFVTPGDAQRMEAGGQPRHTSFEVLTMRKYERTHIDESKWRRMKQGFASTLSHMDYNGTMKKVADEERQRLSSMTSKDVDMGLGDLRKPRIYRETPYSIRMDQVIPMMVRVDGKQVRITVARAFAIALMHNKMVFVSAFAHGGGQTDFQALNHQFDQRMDRMEQLNPNSAMVQGGIDWGEVLRKALIGGLIGLLVALATKFFRKRSATD